MYKIINPYNYLLLSAMLSVASFLFYEYISLMLIYLAIPILLFYLLLFHYGDNLSKKLISSYTGIEIKLKSVYWKFFGLLVLFVSFVEYLNFGFPLFGGVTYNIFGYPFLHHIAVSSWLLVFIKYKNKIFNIFLLMFLLLNPILMSNRDLLLLTIFSLLFTKILEGKISMKRLLLLFLFIILIFGFIGQIRSSYAMDIIELPLKFEKESINVYIFWTILYLTSSTFNMGFNIDNMTTILYEPLINVYPEPYTWYLLSQEIGYYLYFLLLLIIMSYLSIASRNKSFLPLFVYFMYQSLMGVTFSTKVFTTNMIFTVVLFTTYFLLLKISNQNKENHNNLLLPKSKFKNIFNQRI